MLDHEHFSARDMSRSAIYADWLASHGLKHTMALMLCIDGPVHDCVALMRHADQQPFGHAERCLALRLMPDLVRTTRLRSRMSAMATTAALGLAALNALPQGVVVLDAWQCIHHANPAAERLLAQRGPMGVHQGRLRCNEGATQARWQALVAAACGQAGAPRAAGALRLATDAGSLMAMVLPLQPCHAAAVRQRPMALAVLADPHAPLALDHRLVGSALGLSPTEARLALLLASGQSVKDFAACEGVSWHTARTHARNLMGKTGCRRQVELVQLVQALRLA